MLPSMCRDPIRQFSIDCRQKHPIPQCPLAPYQRVSRSEVVPFHLLHQVKALTPFDSACELLRAYQAIGALTGRRTILIHKRLHCTPGAHLRSLRC
jgi:hypothetical protein